MFLPRAPVVGWGLRPNFPANCVSERANTWPDSMPTLRAVQLSSSRSMVNESPLPLSANRDFLLVLLGQGLSAFGSALSVTALPLIVVSLTGSGFQLGLVGALETLPAFALCLVAGAYADRWDRRKVMIYSDLACGLLTAVIPLALWLDLPLMPIIYTVAAPLGVLGVLFVAAYTAALFDLVGREQVGAANAYHQVVVTLGAVIGPGVAGFMLGRYGAATTLLVDALSFVVAAGATMLVRRPLHRASPGARASVREDIVEVLRFVADSALMRAMIPFYALVVCITAPLIPAVTFYVALELGGDESDFGLLLSAYSVGNVAGYAAASRLTRGRLGRLMLASNFAYGWLLIGLALGTQDHVRMGLCGLAGAMSALTHIPYVTLRTTHTPDVMIARVSSTARMMHLGAHPLGLLLGGLAIDASSGSSTLLSVGVLSLLLSLAFLGSSELRNTSALTTRESASEVAPHA